METTPPSPRFVPPTDPGERPGSTRIPGGSGPRRLVLALLMSFAAGAPGGEGDPSAPAAALTTWVVDPLVKVFRESVPGPADASEASAEVARGETASLQVVVRSPGPISALTATLSPLTRTGDAAGSLGGTVRFVGYVPVTKAMSPPQQLHAVPGDFPDPLLEDPAIDVAAAQTQAIWLTVAVPTTAPPGTYHGNLAISATVGTTPVTRSVPISVLVHDVTVGRSRLWVSNWGPFAEWRTWYGNEPRLDAGSDAAWANLRRYARNMAAHRQNVVFTEALKLIDFRPGTSADLDLDFARFDRWVTTFIEEGVIGRIEGAPFASRKGWVAPFTVAIYEREGQGGQVKPLDVPPNDPRAERFYGWFLPRFVGHLRERGWDKLYVQHIGDEAIRQNVPSFILAAQLIRKHAPDLRLAATVHSGLGMGKEFESFSQMPDLFISGPDVLHPHRARLQQLIQGQPRKELWFYTCWQPQGAYANRFIEQRLLATRLLHWMNFRYQATGYLHWGYNQWNTPDPLRFVIHPTKGEHPQVAGDAWIVYPGKHGPLDSIRHEAMRDGIADHELLSLLNDRDPAAAERLAATMVRSFTDYSTEVPAFRATRRDLLRQLAGPAGK